MRRHPRDPDAQPIGGRRRGEDRQDLLVLRREHLLELGMRQAPPKPERLSFGGA
ncbi:hypothetical protein ACWET9_01600 [Streptomyces sp. NPDC004059]